MRHRSMVAILTALAVSACAGDAEDADDTAEFGAETPAPAAEVTEDPDIAPEGEATALPSGYEVRLDQPDATADEYRVTSSDGEMQVETGPAGILYRSDDEVASGDYTVSATFTEVGAPANHREAFGLIFGGRDLQAEGRAYSYFLVRADGQYLIKRRSGEETPDVTDGWQESDAVNAAAEGGDVTNELTVEVEGDQVRFLVNGTEVETRPASELDTHGIAGVRVNHNLNVRVEDFTIDS